MSQTIHRSDYRAPTHLLEDIQLEFDLNAEETLVTSTFTAVSYTHLTLPTKA